MKLEAGSHTGLVRPINEDAFFISEENGIFGVADGLGGHQAGEIASWLALKTAAETLMAPEVTGDPGERLHLAFAKANQALLNRGRTVASCEGMGTTLTLAWEVGATLYIGHIGDSRAYLYREKALTLLTRDHSVSGELVRSGVISQEEAREHPQRHILTRALGQAVGTTGEDVFTVGLREGDYIILCTDGLTSVFSDEEIAMNLETGTLREKIDRLIEGTLERGAPDNVTVIIGFWG